MTEASMLIEDVASTDASKIMKQVLFSGQLDESNIDEKAQAIYQLITQFPKGLNLVFDFEKLEYMNSKSIGYLTDWYGKVTEGGGHLVIIKAKPNIVDILSVIGLTQLIPMFGSVDEAKFSLLSAAPAVTPAQSQPIISTNTTQTMPVTPEVPAVVPAPTVAPEAPVATPAPTPAPEPTPTPEPVATPEVVVPVVMPPVVETPVVAPVVEVPAVVPAPTVAPEAPVATPAPTPAPEPTPTPEPAPVVAPEITIAPETVPGTPEVPPVAPTVNLVQ